MSIAELRSTNHIIPLHRLERSPGTAAFEFSSLRGRITELDASPTCPSFSAAAHLLRGCQKDGEYAAWVRATSSWPFPPDLERVGVDTSSLPMIDATCAERFGGHCHKRRGAASASSSSGSSAQRSAFRATGRLLRSDAFGLVVVDLQSRRDLTQAVTARLAKLAQAHDAVVLLLVPGSGSGAHTGTGVSLRMSGSVERRAPDQFMIQLRATRDKVHGPGWNWTDIRSGVPGLY